MRHDVMSRKVAAPFMKRLTDILRWLRHREEFLLLLALGVIAAGAWVFSELAEVVLDGRARSVDEWLLRWFRDPDDLADPVGGVAIEEAVRDVTALGGTTVTTLITLFATSYLMLARQRRTALFIIVAVLSGVAMTFALKAGFDRPRPELVPHGMHALSASFPSGHAATSALVYLTLAALITQTMPQRRLKVFLVAAAALVTLAVGLSRVYLGVHWPTDVLAGWTIGTAWAIACWLLESDFRQRGWLEPT